MVYMRRANSIRPYQNSHLLGELFPERSRRGIEPPPGTTEKSLSLMLEKVD